MQLKPVQKASKSRVSTPPPPVFVILEGKKIEPHYFVVVRPQSNQNQQKKQICHSNPTGEHVTPYYYTNVQSTLFNKRYHSKRETLTQCWLDLGKLNSSSVRLLSPGSHS